MMNHEECLEYIENCCLSLDGFTCYSLLDFYNGSYHVENLNGDWIEIPEYVGDAFVNWFKEVNEQDED